MTQSAVNASSVCSVSFKLSPLAAELCATAMLMVSAERIFQANSKLVRVRVEFSKNSVMTLRPRKVGAFLTRRASNSLKFSAVSRTSEISSALKSRRERICFWLNCSFIFTAKDAKFAKVFFKKNG